ncbi:hypothetical protein GCM10023321_39130 [Pseudonocardia eucalypti]|uniref:PEP-utilising enzyme mobile domain-containing protein n=1 Tax=Pseudonocardia eucalypti TaxID=648755 RepID=A0ABP9QC89_9PSEU|nr:pyruvate,water dikinase [Pseudonocardia eucalypti]
MDSPVHTRSAPGTRWSTVNYAEAIQGVQSPLGWTYWAHTMELSLRRAFFQIGVFSRREVPPPASPDERTSGAFYGYAAGNVTLFRRIGDAVPGTDADALVEQMFGERRPPVPSRTPLRGRLRSLVVLVKLPVATVGQARALGPARRGVGAWWRANVVDRPPTTAAEATELLRDSVRWFARVGTAHTVLTMVGQALAEQVERLAPRGREQASDLMTGYGSFEETAMLGDLWELAGGRLELAEFLGRHGYHGPDEGNLTSVVWREDPAPVHRLARRYRDAEVDHPRANEARQLARREAAERELFAGLGAVDRVRARAVLWAARRLIPMREVGKSGFLHALDGARCAARTLGARYAEAGLLADAEDVFFLTLDELLAGLREPAHELVERRRADHVRFQGLRLPPAWTGDPVPEERSEPAVAAAPAEVTELHGIGVVGDVVTGRARVITDPADADLDPGDVLVCRTTDPSWTPLFLVAAALVIDTGGAMSHGAIVARELGVTCVINTGTGSLDIPDGATVTVDGRAGLVTIKPSDQVRP